MKKKKKKTTKQLKGPDNYRELRETCPWPLNSSQIACDLVLIKTSLLLLWKPSCSYASYVTFKKKIREIYVKARLPPTSLVF